MRRRFVQIDGELVEVAQDWSGPSRQRTDAVLWNDRLYQDANDPRFFSRTQHREYMRRNGVTTTDDFTNSFKEAEKRKIEAKQGVDKTRKQDIVEALRRLDAKRR